MIQGELLNDKQKEAIETTEGPILVIAGAGTGKTKTIVHRLAKLVEKGVPAENILLLTFTRKAAREMLSRAVGLLDKRCARVHGGTFHSFSSHLLRKYAGVLGFSSQFSVLDESDCSDIFQLLRSGGEYTSQKSRFPSNDTLISLHSAIINRGKTLEELLKADYPKFLDQQILIQKIFEDYARYKKERSLVDYDDLLVYCLELLNKHESVRKKISEQYKYIMVDEFQDTNQIQAHIACLLALDHENILVVGDDAQSVYSFRGADVNGIFNFPKIFPKTKIVYLERNYRSTPSILNLANVVLSNFREKYEKYLHTKNDDFQKPSLVGYADELEEAEGIADLILERREDGVPLEQIAVLFRSGWNSNQLELVLSRRNIPFLKFGGRKFVESAHAKDYLSLLKIKENRADSLSWLRILLLIPGIGSAKAKTILSELEEGKSSLGEIFSTLRGVSSSYLRELQALLEDSEENLQKLLGKFIDFYSPLLEKKYDDSKRRQEDLNAFLTLSQKYGTLHEFLVDVSLEGPSKSLDKIGPDEEEERLVLSTVHSAKGLEFDTVILLNVSEGSFPSGRGEKNIEEERRLFYVAITRAKKKLVLTYPQISVQKNAQHFNRVSRFVEEIKEPEKVLEKKFIAKQEPNSSSTRTNPGENSEIDTDARKRIREFFGS